MAKQIKKTESEVARDVISERAENLHKLSTAVNEAYWAYRREYGLMVFLLENYPSMLSEQAQVSVDSAMRSEQANEEIKTFCLTGQKHPFFSEATLYELVGKDDARKILRLVEDLQKRATR